MPRLPTSLIRKAYSYSPLLPLLLKATRDLALAKNELRWLQEHISSIHRLRKRTPKQYLPKPPTLSQLCRIRSTGEPLQYILGSQPFGDLEILCRKGVLIPRPETEVYTTRLSNLLLRHGSIGNGNVESLQILDLCAGTGCIGLSLYAALHRQIPDVRVRAIDFNPQARNLAWKTVKLNQHLGRLSPSLSESQFDYVLADLLNNEEIAAVVQSDATFNIVVSNPPYISIPAFSRDTSRSARIFEPSNALVPPDSVGITGERTGDLFYDHILRLSWRARPQIVCMEVADLEQALRVMRAVKDMEAIDGSLWEAKQIWRDEIDVQGNECSTEWNADVNAAIIGEGSGRAVVLARSWGVDVIKHDTAAFG